MKGIIFTEQMFHAVVAGTKTQTRQIIKQQPKEQPISWVMNQLSIHPEYDIYNDSFYYKGDDGIDFIKPHYKVGEILYLKEPYCLHEPNAPINARCNCIDWQSKLSMPAKYARYFIEITDVRCERAQDISDDDCLKDGVYELKGSHERWGFPMYLNDIVKNNRAEIFKTPQEAYTALFNIINGKGTWESNPYVWIYDFKLTNKLN